MNSDNLHRKEVDNYLSLRRIVVLSLTITMVYYALFGLTFYFSRPMFDNPTGIERWDGQDEEAMADTVVRIQPEFHGPRHQHHEPPEFHARRMLQKIILNIPLTFVMVFAVLLYDRRVMGKKPRGTNNLAFRVVFGSICVGILLSTLCTVFQWYAMPDWRPPHSLSICMVKGWLGDLPLYAFAVMSAYLLRTLHYERMKAIENETLRAENINSRYEALKNQIDPHFMFNSLNTLQSLIDIDSEKAEEFVQQMSSVLRYTLQSKEVATLAEEIDCVRAYCLMMKMRYGDNLQFDHHIDHERYDRHLVLPLSIQGLMENAIKHNVISSKQPLTIHISTTDDNHLVISNKIQPKINKEEGSGIGLANLAERYRLKWNENVEISDDGMNFSVTLPLKEL